MADRETLPSVEIINWDGLYTKNNPESLQPSQMRECKNADFFTEYGALTKLKGTKRILNSQYSESATAKSISWGDFYKTQDLAGRIDRQELISAGTTIQKVNTDGSLTQLLANEPDNLARTSDMLDRFMFITSQDPFAVGTRGQMSKYDGTKITQWGLTPPGEQETIIESCNDATIWSASAIDGAGAVFNATVADSTDIAFTGTSTQMTKASGGTNAYCESLNRSVFPINNIIDDRARLQVFIPTEYYNNLATSGRAISIYIGSGADLSNNYYRFDFQIGRLIAGWNTLIFDFSTVPSGNFGTQVGTPDDDNLASIRFEIITNVASDEAVVYWDNLVSLDQGGAVPTLGDPGGSVFPQSTTATWTLRVTFIDEYGNESNSGPVSITADNTTGATDFGSITWNNIPVGSASIVRRDLYRTRAGGAEWLFLATINDNVTTSYEDTIPDASLGVEIPPSLGEAILDNSPPPSGGICAVWRRTAFVAGDPLNPNLLYYSRFDLPEAFPVRNALEFDERITGMFSTYLGLVVVTDTAYWRIIGDNPDFTVDKVINGFGGVGPRGVGTARETGWIVDRDGMRLYDLRQASKISEVIRDRIDAFNSPSLEETHTAHSKRNNGIYWFVKDANGVYSDIYFYQYAIDDISQGWFSQIVPSPSTFNIVSMWEIEDSNGAFRLHCGTDAGMVFEFMNPETLNWVNETGQTRPIEMQLQTPYMRLGDVGGGGPYDQQYQAATGRITPRFVELRAREASGKAHNWTILVETSDSSAEGATPRDSKTMNFQFPAGVSLLRLSLADITPAEYIRLTITNADRDVDVAITGLRMEYNIRPGQFAVTGAQARGGGQT